MKNLNVNDKGVIFKLLTDLEKQIKSNEDKNNEKINSLVSFIQDVKEYKDYKKSQL